MSTLLLIVAISAVIFLAFLPGEIALRRKHPQYLAIKVCGLLGLLFFPCLLIAVVWSLMTPKRE